MNQLINTIVLPTIDISEDIKTELLVETSVESQIIVHCHFFAVSPMDCFRIWKTTFLVDQINKTKSKLIHAENVPFYPTWKMAGRAGWHSFTLVFEALPKTCKVFDLIEDIPEDGAFQVCGIARNESDVYNVEF